jgi:hypothetical protein
VAIEHSLKMQLQAVVISPREPLINHRVFVHEPLCKLHVIVVTVQFSSRVKLCCTCGLSSNKVWMCVIRLGIKT